jgi:hypothetical protein
MRPKWASGRALAKYGTVFEWVKVGNWAGTKTTSSHKNGVF